MQHLNCRLVDVKLAPSDNADSMTFSGYGAVFGNVDAYGDVIEPGAFAKFLSDASEGKQAWPAMLLQHGGWGMSAEDLTPIGVWTDLSEDGKGLKVSGQLADTPRGREVHQLLKMTPRPAIDGLSIGYVAKEWEPRTKPDEPRRRLKRIDLMEISPVTFPANAQARVGSVKSFEDFQSLSDVEHLLRDVGGFSHREAKTLIARIKALSSRDAGGNEVAAVAAALSRNTRTLRTKS